MGGACGMHWENEIHTKCLLGNLKGRDHLEFQGVVGRLILKLIFGKWG